MTLLAPLEPTKIGAGDDLRDGGLHRVLGEAEGRCQQPQRQYNQQGEQGAGADTRCRSSAHNCAGGGNCGDGGNAKADDEDEEDIRDNCGRGADREREDEEGEEQQQRGPHHSDRKIPRQHRWPAHDLAPTLLESNPCCAEDPSETAARAFDKDCPIGAEHHAEARVTHGADPRTVPGDNWRRYELKVVQQPVRARMCGFGDKDRRPATPPPVVELIVRNAHGTEIDVPSLDVSFYVVTCDLFSADGLCEVNLIVHSTAGAVEADQSGRRRRRKGECKIESSAAGEETRPCSPPINASDAAAKRDSRPMTRNLVGLLVANAVKLTRLDAEPVTQKNAPDSVARVGIFFVFPDLSIRTEGRFRLQFSFVDLRSELGNAMTTGTTHVRAQTFSDVFTVYCAKKFPGMIDSTPLSRWFAQQGVKIHGRRDKTSRRRVSQAEEAKPAAEEERNLDETVESMSVALPAHGSGLVGATRIVQADEAAGGAEETRTDPLACAPVSAIETWEPV